MSTELTAETVGLIQVTARYEYTCARCSRAIKPRQVYFRLDPHGMAKYYRGVKTQHFCYFCIEGREYWEVVKKRADAMGQLILPLELDGLGVKSDDIIVPRVQVVNVRQQLIRTLQVDPDGIYKLSPEAFEELICDRLQDMGYCVQRVGSHAYHKDGGVDAVALLEDTTFPFLIAVQIKHHRSPKYKTGPSHVREFQATVQNNLFNAGILVTNTTFTPDALWVAENQHRLVRLRDITDIQRWLHRNFLDEQDWREIPEEIELCPGVKVTIPRPKALRPFSSFGAQLVNRDPPI